MQCAVRTSLLVSVALLAISATAPAAELTREKHDLGGDLGIGTVAVSSDGKLYALVRALPNDTSVIRLFNADNSESKSKFFMEGQITCIQFTPDCKYLVAGSTNNQCAIWDIDTTKQVGTLSSHTDAIICLAICPKSNRIATSSFDKTVKIWDLDNKKLLATLKTSLILQHVAFSPTGEYLVTGGKDKFVRIWNTTSFEKIFAFDSHSEALACFAILPDGEAIATVAADGEIKLWDINISNKTANDRLHTSIGRGIPTLVVVHPKGHQIAIGLLSGEVMLCNMNPEAVVSEMKINSHKLPITGLSYSHDGKKLLLCSYFESYYCIFSGLPR